MIPLRTYIVTFCVRDCYRIELTALCEDDALARAQDLYHSEGEEPFEFDFSDGGTTDWNAEEVQP
jgi:hypothetical protein